MCLFLVGGAFGGNRGLSPVPPEKGVFPLDHMHLCDLVMSLIRLMNILFHICFLCRSKFVKSWFYVGVGSVWLLNVKVLIIFLCLV